LREKGRPDDDAREYIHALAPLKVTEREAEVARFVAWGFDNADIAEALRVTLSTVKTHVEHLLLKLGVEKRGVLCGEVRRLVRAYRAECERKRAATALRLVREKKPRKARADAEPGERREA
jgi:DNA-binding NarL/FixJ family response regulator